MSNEEARTMMDGEPTLVEAGAGRWAAARDCGLLVGLFAVFLLLRPLQNAPFVDDAVYGWSVQWLMEHGQIRILEYSHINPVQIVWGWLFCLPGGFSFSACRLSNWVLGASTLCSLYLILREFGVSRKMAVAGAATLAVNPIFVILSCSFMTDVPLLAMAVWASYALILAVRRKSDRWLWISAMFSALACGVRVPGAVLPVATGCVLLFNTKRWGWRPDRLLAAVVPLVLFGVMVVLQPAIMQPTVDISVMQNSMSGRLYMLTYAWKFLPLMFQNSVLFAATMGGLCMLPLAVGGIRVRDWQKVGVVLAGLVALVITAYWTTAKGPYHPLWLGQTWEMGELGATSDLVTGRIRPVYPRVAMEAVYWVSLVAGAVVLAQALWRRAVAGEPVLRWQVLGHFMLIAVLWLTYDRYILPIFPLLIVMFLISVPRIRPVVFGGAAVVMFAVSFVGLHDHLAYNRALWGAVDALRGQGVAVSSIDAGYSANLWMHYAHPEDAPRDAEGKPFVPHMTSRRSLEYLVANSPQPGYEVRQIVPVSKWLGRDTSLYVLHQMPGAVLPDPDKATEKW